MFHDISNFLFCSLSMENDLSYHMKWLNKEIDTFLIIKILRVEKSYLYLWTTSHQYFFWIPEIMKVIFWIIILFFLPFLRISIFNSHALFFVFTFFSLKKSIFLQESMVLCLPAECVQANQVPRLFKLLLISCAKILFNYHTICK